MPSAKKKKKKDRIAVSGQKKKNFLKIVRGHEKSIQYLVDDAKNIRLIRINEEKGESANDIKKGSS